TRSASVGPQIQNHLSSIASAKEEKSKIKNPLKSPSASCIRKMTLRIHQNGVKRTRTDPQFHPMSSPRQTLEQPGTAETDVEPDGPQSKFKNQNSKIFSNRGNGKVARLPKPIRDQIGNMILDGVS